MELEGGDIGLKFCALIHPNSNAFIFNFALVCFIKGAKRQKIEVGWQSSRDILENSSENVVLLSWLVIRYLHGLIRQVDLRFYCRPSPNHSANNNYANSGQLFCLNKCATARQVRTCKMQASAQVQHQYKNNKTCILLVFASQ